MFFFTKGNIVVCNSIANMIFYVQHTAHNALQCVTSTNLFQKEQEKTQEFRIIDYNVHINKSHLPIARKSIDGNYS